MKTVSFIGTGNMGGAMARAAVKALECNRIFLANRTHEKAVILASELGANAVSVTEAARCSLVFLGVKPQMMNDLLQEISPVLEDRTDDFALVSMAAGLSIEKIQKMAGRVCPVIRIMPNTPVSVGSGTILYDYSCNVNSDLLELFCNAMQFAGMLDHLPEDQIDAATAVAGCGPAFAFYFIEALTRGGVACGLTEEKALQYAKQMLLGSALLAQRSDIPPSQLRQAVCSPGGSTIEGIYALDTGGFIDTVSNAVKASYRRNIELGK